MRITAWLLSAVGLAAYVQADHSDLVLKAIQQSRQRQSSRVASANGPTAKNVAAAAAAATASGKKGTAQQRPLGASKSIDVDALNNLIKSFDKTWALPKEGAKEPVGSNFQYKKTCASIYKARPGACSQLGFGSMCFNYCFEKGEKVTYQCSDASDAAYCKSSSNFDAYLTKYKKDAYKAKAYVHQMISRCFATALCNGNGILEARAIETSTPKTREMNHLKLTKPANTATKKSPVKATAAPASTTTTETTEAPAKPISGRPKKVPEWQKLMGKATTEKSTKKEEEEEEELATTEAEGSMEEVEIEVEEEETTVATTRAPKGPARKAASKKTVAPAATAAASSSSSSSSVTTAASRATFKPLKTLAPPTPYPSASEELAIASHTGEKTPKEDTFWNRFQPNTWYQSIHYLTNTGR
ncbi:hypothetical protein PENTCL1PPCAC_71 [Pristionchus entomophagus]|uniref:Uncharacterized protein n=1 Tax=Pristionchus entomophagus TaxID=358040 RepID=A0AAV5S5V9_9BILA|nr:hypothetical protein PENTCL1PPCAC_71 [Pristionchus entomophagus]